jgi:cytochrome c-type biogenesis protein CcmH
MILWLVLAGLIALALAFLVRPLLRRTGGQARTAAYDLEVYRDQLAEIDRDRAREMIDDADAEAARLEVQRRMLAADARAEPAASTEPLSTRFVLVIVLAVPLIAGSLYIAIGRPDLAGASVPATARAPTAAEIRAVRKMTPEQRLKMIRSMVARLAARLKQDPENLTGWLRLGRAYDVLGERQRSAKAYGRAAALAPKNVKVQTLYTMALLKAHRRDKPLTPAIRKAVFNLLALDHNHPLGLYYAGVIAAAAGRNAEAIGHWQRLLAVLPKKSPLRARLAAQIAALKARVPNPAPSPTPPKQP